MLLPKGVEVMQLDKAAFECICWYMDSEIPQKEQYVVTIPTLSSEQYSSTTLHAVISAER